MSDISVILAQVRGSDRDDAIERLIPLVYDELPTLARAHLRRERPDHSLEATALVHEAYLRLLGDARPPWSDRRRRLRARWIRPAPRSGSIRKRRQAGPANGSTVRHGTPFA